MTSRLPAFRPQPGSVHLPTNAIVLALGVAGGLAAKALGLPLPLLLGSLTAVAAAALSGWQPAGRPLVFPTEVRTLAIPVLGVSIGSAVGPGILADLARWWPGLVALLVVIPAAHLIGYTIMRRLGGLDRTTAWFAAAPGGLIEAVALGEARGADPAMLATLQFLRLILSILLVPIGFTLITGHAVGSAAGAVMGGDVPLTGPGWAILAVCAVLGAMLGTALRLPAGIITGPILLSGAVHVLGWVDGGPPRWLVDAMQLAVGLTLGVRFSGRSPGVVLSALGISLVSTGALMALAAAVAVTLPPVVGEGWQAVFLAFAPGGLAEMSLVALSLEISAIYVTLHHIARILIAVTVAQLLADRIIGR